MSEETQRLISLKAAAKLLDISIYTAIAWAKQGQIPTVTLGSLRKVPVEFVEKAAREGIPTK